MKQTLREEFQHRANIQPLNEGVNKKKTQTEDALFRRNLANMRSTDELDEVAPPEFGPHKKYAKIYNKVKKEYGDTDKAYKTMWAIHNKLKETKDIPVTEPLVRSPFTGKLMAKSNPITRPPEPTGDYRLTQGLQQTKRGKKVDEAERSYRTFPEDLQQNHYADSNVDIIPNEEEESFEESFAEEIKEESTTSAVQGYSPINAFSNPKQKVNRGVEQSQREGWTVCNRAKGEIQQAIRELAEMKSTKPVVEPQKKGPTIKLSEMDKMVEECVEEYFGETKEDIVDEIKQRYHKHPKKPTAPTPPTPAE